MKKIFLSIAMVSLTFAMAQKKEISAAFKAASTNDMATATSQIAAADAILSGKTYLLEPEVLEQYYFVKGLTLLKAGKVSEGAANISKIMDLGKLKIYTGKDASKNKVYYVGKSTADASGISGLKEESYSPVLAPQISAMVNPLFQAANKAAVDAYNAKNFVLAGDKFKEAYYLYKAGGTDDKSILMNAALSYSNAEKTEQTVDIYNELINAGYTGVETTYSAKNKKTGSVDNFDKATWETLRKTSNSDYTEFKSETSKNIEKELYQINARNLYTLKRYNEAIALIDKGLLKFPNDPTLMNIKGLSYFAAGKSSEFIQTLKAQVAANPNDFESWYNLGVMQKNANQDADALISFQKSVEIKPDYANAYQNLAYMLMGDDETAIKDIEAARKAGKTDQFNKLLETRRQRFSKALPYAEKWYQYDKENIDAVTLLKGLYTTTKNEAKAAEFKAKEAAMQAQGK